MILVLMALDKTGRSSCKKAPVETEAACSCTITTGIKKQSTNNYCITAVFNLKKRFVCLVFLLPEIAYRPLHSDELIR
jgi:hypothetical protein